MPHRYIAAAGMEPSGDRQKAFEAGPSLSGIGRHGSINGISDDRGDRHSSASRLGTEAEHLFLGQRDLRSNHL